MLENSKSEPVIRSLARSLFFPMLGWFFFVGSLPLIALGIGYYRQVSRLLQKEFFDRLQAIGQRQVNSIESTITKTKGLLEIFTGTRRMAHLLPALEQMKVNPDPKFCNEVLAQCDSLIGKVSKVLGFKDFLIFGLDGELLYAASGTASFQLGILNSDFRYPHLRLAFQKAMSHLSTQVARLDLGPSYDPLPLFIVTPIIVEFRLKGLAVVRLNNEDFYQVVKDYSGLGATGETLLISDCDDGYILFNPTRFGGKLGLNDYAGLHPMAQQLIQNALKSESGFCRTVDYRNHEVLAAWNYLPSTHWGIVVKSDASELVAPMGDIERYTFFVIALTLVLLFFASSFVAATLSQPFRLFARTAYAITEGRLYFDFKTYRNEGQHSLFVIIKHLLDSLSAFRNQVKLVLNHGLMQLSVINKGVYSCRTANRNLEQYAVTMASSVTVAYETSRAIVQRFGSISLAMESLASSSEGGLKNITEMHDAFIRVRDYNDAQIFRFDAIHLEPEGCQEGVQRLLYLCNQMDVILVNLMMEASILGAQGRGVVAIAKKLKEFAKEFNGVSESLETSFGHINAVIKTNTSEARVFSENLTKVIEHSEKTSTQLLHTVQQIQGIPSLLTWATEQVNTQEATLKLVKVYAKRMSTVNDELYIAFAEIIKELEYFDSTYKKVQSHLRRFCK